MNSEDISVVHTLFTFLQSLHRPGYSGTSQSTELNSSFPIVKKFFPDGSE